jgi:hypothetical protein
MSSSAIKFAKVSETVYIGLYTIFFNVTFYDLYNITLLYMVKIGLICWKQGGGTNDYIQPDKSKTWHKGLPIVKKGEFKGLIPFEKALHAALEHNYSDVEVMYMNSFNE